MTQEKQPETREIPPYVAWKTFWNFLDWLRTTMPSRIDRSLMGTMSGATQAQLISALRFINLISDNGTPTQKLRDLARAEGESRKELLGDVVTDAYLDVVRDVDLDAGTYRQLAEAFEATGAQGETLRKCIAFYLLALREAGVSLSPHFNVRGARSASTRRRKASTPRAQTSQRSTEADDASEERIPPGRTRFEILVEKFPTFDPSWSAEVQTKWFDAFTKLQSLNFGDEDLDS